MRRCSVKCLLVSSERASVRFDGRDLKVTVSAGVAEARRGGSSQELLVRADAALYGAKRAGRNQTHLHDGQDDTAISRRAAAVGVACQALSAFHAGPIRRRGLVLGFGAVPEDAIPDLVERLAGVLQDSR